MDHPKHMRERLAHVYWIGGPPDAGKTTVATTLAATYDAQAYFQDRNEMNHIRRAESGKPPLHVDLRQRLEAESPTESFFEPWVCQGPEELAQQSRALWAERIDMICDDLLALEPDRPIIMAANRLGRLALAAVTSGRPLDDVCVVSPGNWPQGPVLRRSGQQSGRNS